MYLWLKQGAEKQLQVLKEQELVGDLRMEIDRTSGKKYIKTYIELGDPTSEIAEVLSELVERVTVKERIFRGFRVEGVYRHNGATLTVRTETRSLEYLQEVWQWVNISSPSVEAAKAIYSLLRQGKLTPDENWEEHIPLTQPATKPAEET